MSSHTVLYRVLSVLALFGLVISIYLLGVRPSQQRWGATDEELARAMPADKLVSHPTFVATRAVTIEGTPEEIWPWLVQIGHGRAGFYGYDLIENIGSPRGLRSAQRIIPELQGLAVGDRVYMSSYFYLVVPDMEANRYLVWADEASPPSSAFTWALYPIDEDHTRLVSRIRFRHHWTQPLIVVDLFTDVTDHVAVRKVLLGVKERVEGRVEPMARQNVEIALWALAFLEFSVATVLILTGRHWWRAWLVALAAAGVLLTTLYLHPPLWIGALLVIAILIGLRWATHRASAEKTPGRAS
jgi:hypothetical protein